MFIPVFRRIFIYDPNSHVTELTTDLYSQLIHNNIERF